METSLPRDDNTPVSSGHSSGHLIFCSSVLSVAVRNCCPWGAWLTSCLPVEWRFHRIQRIQQTRDCERRQECGRLQRERLAAVGHPSSEPREGKRRVRVSLKRPRTCAGPGGRGGPHPEQAGRARSLPAGWQLCRPLSGSQGMKRSNAAEERKNLPLPRSESRCRADAYPHFFNTASKPGPAPLAAFKRARFETAPWMLQTAFGS